MGKVGLNVIRALLVLLALGVAAILILPMWFGMKAQAHYEASIDRFNGEFGPIARLETLGYDKGWFSSRVETLISYADVPFKLKFDHVVTHGPLNLPGLTGREPLLVMAVIDSELSPGDAPGGQSMILLSGESVIAMNGDVESLWHLEPQIAAMLGAGAQPVWARFSVEAASGQAQMQAHLPEVSIQSPQGDLKMSDLRWSMDVRPSSLGDFIVGGYTLSMKYLRVGDLMSMTVLEDTRLRVTAVERGNKINTEMALSIETLDSPAGVMGPARFTMQLNNLDAQGLQTYSEMQQAMFSDMKPGMDPEAMNALSMQMMGTVPMLLSEAEVRIPALYLATADGAMRGTVTINLPSLDESAMMMPMAVLPAITAQAELLINESMLRMAVEGATRKRLMNAGAGGEGVLGQEEIDQTAAEQTNAQLSVLTSQGYLQLVDGVYRTRLTMEGGNLMVNGKPLNPAMLMQ